MRSIIGLTLFAVTLASSAQQPEAVAHPEAVALVVTQAAPIDETHAGARVEFRIDNPPANARTLVILNANAEPVVAAGKGTMHATALVYGSGTHRFSAELYDDAGNLVGTTSQSVPVAVTATTAQLDNGISVGFAKQFDDRALVAMLRDVEAALQAQQGTAFRSVADAVGRFQGQTVDRSSFGVSATTLGTPGTETNTSTKTTDTGTTASNEVKTDATGTTTTAKNADPSQNVETNTSEKVTRSAITPSVPQAPTPAAATFTQTTLGIGAEDLLNEQANLSAQYTSLRLLLQRSLSDRVVQRANGSSEPRAQPVYGFQISIDPTRQYRDAVAEAIITVSLPADDLSGRDAPRLVTLLPKEKTYNVAEVMSRSRALSLGGIVQAVNVGATINRSRETLYVVRDTDTVALEKAPTGAAARTSTSFAWQFRPVLGKRIVGPGTRQVFAVLALPTSINEPWDGVVSVTTQWRKYDRRTKTAGIVIPDSVSHQEAYPISVSRLREQETAVASAIEDIELRDAGAAALVSLQGHFPPGTLVSMADTVIDTAANGLLVKTPRRISFIVAPERLFFGPTLIDSFGVATRLTMPDGNTPPSFRILAAGPEERFAVYLRSTAQPQLFGTDPFAKGIAAEPRYLFELLRAKRSSAVHLRHPLALLAHTVFGLSTAPIQQEEGVATCNSEKNARLCKQLNDLMARNGWKATEITKLTFDVPPTVTQDARVVRILEPFHGGGEYVEEPITFDKPAKSILIGELQFVDISNADAQLALTGQLLATAEDLTLRVGGTNCETTKIVADSLVVFRCNTAALATATRAIVTYKGAEPKLLALPPLPSLRVQVLRQEPIREGEARPVRLEGNALSAVTGARYNGTALRISHDSGTDNTMYVDVPAVVTGSAGDKLIQLLLNDGRVLETILTVDPKTKG